MIWRAGTQFLVGDGPYRLIDATGAITKEYAESTWQDDDYEGRTTFLVTGNQLLERTEVGHSRHHMEDSDNSRVVLDNLVEDTSEETARFIATVLGDHAVSAEERRLREEREAEARLDAIAGARQPIEHRESERARAALVHRVVRYSDDRAAELLRTLVEIVRAGVHEEARDAYVRGCLLACFSLVAPALVEGAMNFSPLGDRVSALADRVQRDADYQSAIDANANARELWAAAEALRACARMLGAVAQ